MASPTPKKPSKRVWKVPDVVPRSAVRAHLAAITREAVSGREILVGASKTTAYSAFISDKEFDRRKASFAVKVREIDIETLRTNWSREREQVENTGGPLRILRKKESVAVFVPTQRALDKKVPQTLETLDKSHVDLLHKLDQRVTKLEVSIDALTGGILNEESLKELRQTMAVARVVLKEWRKNQGFGEEPPSGPPNQ